VKRVLIVAYYFPPIGGIGSIRLARMAHYLPEFGWEPVVLAPRNTPHPVDPGLSFDEERVVRSKSIELSRLGRLLHNARRSVASPDPEPTRTPGSEGIGGRARQMARGVLFPDPQIGWWPGAVHSGSQLLRRERFDAVFSSSFPITAHLVADSLRRRAELPWIAEFRDPWSDRLPAVPYRRAARGLERRIARVTDQVVMPTPTWAAHFGAAWATDVAVLPNGHEMAPASDLPSDPPVLAHVGSHYPEQQCGFSTLWNALAHLRAEGDTVPRVRWVGPVPDSMSAELSGAGGIEIEVTGPVPHERATRLMSDASMLFASGPRRSDPISRGWVPAKLFEYIASGRSVLFIGDPAGDAALLLRGQPGCFVCHPSDRDGILKALRDGLTTSTHQRATHALSRRSRAEELAGLLGRVAGA
jgi:glycosyltransferase involved in cell wall biosynthesis